MNGWKVSLKICTYDVRFQLEILRHSDIRDPAYGRVISYPFRIEENEDLKVLSGRRAARISRLYPRYTGAFIYLIPIWSL